jgi:hypothetical protein
VHRAVGVGQCHGRGEGLGRSITGWAASDGARCAQWAPATLMSAKNCEGRWKCMGGWWRRGKLGG